MSSSSSSSSSSSAWSNSGVQDAIDQCQEKHRTLLLYVYESKERGEEEEEADSEDGLFTPQVMRVLRESREFVSALRVERDGDEWAVLRRVLLDLGEEQDGGDAHDAPAQQVLFVSARKSKVVLRLTGHDLTSARLLKHLQTLVAAEKARRKREAVDGHGAHGGGDVDLSMGRATGRGRLLSADMKMSDPTLSSEEKKRLLQLKVAAAKDKRARREMQNAVAREKARVAEGRAAIDLQRRQDELRAQAIISDAKKERERKRAEKKRIRNMVRRDQAERKAAARERRDQQQQQQEEEEDEEEEEQQNNTISGNNDNAADAGAAPSAPITFQLTSDEMQAVASFASQLETRSLAAQERAMAQNEELRLQSARVRIGLLDGQQVVREFAGDTPLADLVDEAVRALRRSIERQKRGEHYSNGGGGDGDDDDDEFADPSTLPHWRPYLDASRLPPFVIGVTFPRRTFTFDDAGASLAELGLVPSAAVLMVEDHANPRAFAGDGKSAVGQDSGRGGGRGGGGGVTGLVSGIIGFVGNVLWYVNPLRLFRSSNSSNNGGHQNDDNPPDGRDQ